MKGDIKQVTLRSLSSKKDTKRSSKISNAAQAESENAEAQAKNENAAAEAKSENTEAEAEEVEGTCTGTMVSNVVETTGEAGGRHPGLHTVNEEAGHIVLNTEHVQHDEIVIENENAEAEAEGVEGTSTETMLNHAVEATGGTGEEHSELSMVIEESDHIVGEEHHARCVHSDEEAGSFVLAGEATSAKETEEIFLKDVEIRRLIEERRRTPEEEKQRLKEVSKCFTKCIREKNEKTARHPKKT